MSRRFGLCLLRSDRSIAHHQGRRLERSAVSTTAKHDPPETDQGNDYDQDGDSEDEETTPEISQTIICTGICEWEGCDQILRGPDTPSLLYVSSSVSLYTLLQI